MAAVSQQWIREQRLAAALWARRMLNSGFVILDAETTGLEHDDEFVQIGVLDHTGEVLVDTLVRPQKQVAPGASAVHGITASALAESPPFEVVYSALAAALTDRLVIAYNVDFDRRILKQTLSRYGLRGIRVLRWECAMQEYARFLGRWNARHRSFRWVKLAMACGIEKIPVQGAHSAAGDCLMTLRLVEAMAAAAPGDGQTGGVAE